MRTLPAIIPATAGVLFFAWALIATMGDVPGCGGATYEDAVDSWAFVGVFTALLVGIVGAAILARRLAGWLALAATVLLALAIATGAQAGWAIGMRWAGCSWDDGPALTLSLFVAPAALFGFAMGWVLRRATV